MCHICKEIFDKAEFVRDHQSMLHVDYKYSCSETNCLRILKTKCGQKRHVENKHKSPDTENCIVVKEEENGTVPVKQEQNDLSNVSVTTTESRESRGRKKKLFWKYKMKGNSN